MAAISDRVYEDVVVAGYCALHPDRFTEIYATVDGKTFGQRAWLYVPRPSGNLLKVIAETPPHQTITAFPEDGSHRGTATPHGRSTIQLVGEGIAVTGGVRFVSGHRRGR